MTIAIALVVVALIGFVPSYMQARTAAKQTATSNGIPMGVMVEAMYHRQARIETTLNTHIESPNPHKWDPDIVASFD